MVFIKAGSVFPDAFVMTDSAIIRAAPSGTIRRSRQASDINLQPLPRGGSPGGRRKLGSRLRTDSDHETPGV
jgi:hypothetical protein